MITRYVNTASTAGGDGTTNGTAGATRAFASLYEAITSLPGTLTDATTILCEGTAPDTTSVMQTEWDVVTTAAHYLLVQGNNRTGKWDTSKYRLEILDGDGLYTGGTPHLRWDALQVQITRTTSAVDEAVCFRVCSVATTASDVDCRVSNCIARMIQLGTDGITGFYPSTPNGTGTVRHWNCVAYGGQYGFQADEAAITKFYNCTAYGGLYFGFTSGGDLSATNCLAAMYGIADFAASGTKLGDHNASSDATVAGTGSRASQTFTFANPSIGDLHLKSTDGGAKGFGATDPASGLYSDDIDGQTRTGSWDIGADQYVAPTIALTGTAAASITETDVVAGGKTAILTVTGNTYVDATGIPLFVAGNTKGTTAADTAGGGGGRTSNGALTCTFPLLGAVAYVPQPGDLAIMLLWSDQGSGSIPTDWNELTGSPFGSGTEKFQVFWKVLVGGESAPVTTISGSTTNMSHCAQMAIYSGAVIGAIGAATTGTGVSMTAAAITTTADNAIVLGLCGRGDNENASAQTFGASATGVAERLDGGTAAGNDSQISMYDKRIATSGTSSGAGAATTSATDPFISLLLEIKPSAPFASARAAIAAGLDSAQAEAAGWDAKVKPNIPVGNVVRTSDTVVTVTLQAQADYDITAQETITATLPATALSIGQAVAASPTFTVATASSSGRIRHRSTMSLRLPTPQLLGIAAIAPQTIGRWRFIGGLVALCLRGRR